MSVTVRPVQPDEYDRTGRIVLDAYDRVGTITGSYREFMADTGRRIADGSLVWVAVDPDGDAAAPDAPNPAESAATVLGTVTFSDTGDRHFELEGQGDCGFRLLAVDPGFQGRGVGRVLVEACIAEARARHRVRMVIYTMEWMPAAQQLYASLGFTRRPDLDVRFPSGGGVALQLDLDPARATDGRFPVPGPVPPEPPWYEDVLN